MKKKDVIKFVLSLALAVVLVWFAFRSVDWKAFWEGLKVTRWIWLVPFLTATLGALLLRSLRWQILLAASGHRCAWLDVWDANNIGNMANVAIPGSGEFLRCGYVARKEGYGDALGTAVMERVWDFIAIVVIVVLALFLDRHTFGPFFAEEVWGPLSERMHFSMGWLAGLVVALLVVFFWAVFHFRTRNRFCGKIADALASVGRGFASFRKLERKVAFLLYTIGIWLCYLLMCYSVMKAIPALEGLGLKDALFFTAVGNLASVIPVPGGIGAYHYLIAFSASTLYGHSWETGILFATLQHELHNFLILILGVVSYFRFTLHDRKVRLREEADHSSL